MAARWNSWTNYGTALRNALRVTLSGSVLTLQTSGRTEVLRKVAVGFKPSAADRAKVAVFERERLSISHMRQLTLAVFQYAQDQRSQMPNFRSQSALQTSLMPYLKSKDVFTVPGTNKFYRSNGALANLTWERVKTLKAMNAPVFWEPEVSAAGTRGVGFLDNTQQMLSEKQFSQLSRKYKLR